MKKNFKHLLVTCLILTSVTLLAQDEGVSTTGSGGGSSMAIGAKIGANFNQFSQPLTNIGGSVGGFVRYQILDFLEAQGELIYSQQGGGRMDYTRDFSFIDGPIRNVQYVNRSIMLHNIEVPISARLTMPEFNGGAIVPKLIVGGSYSYNMAAMEYNDKIFNFVDGTRGLVSNTTENVSLNYFPHNFSVHAGIALDFNLADAKVFTMEFKYRKGFSNLNQVMTTITELTDKLYSSAFSVNFSYRIF